jgi:hypothetical protein
MQLFRLLVKQLRESRRSEAGGRHRPEKAGQGEIAAVYVERVAESLDIPLQIVKQT